MKFHNYLLDPESPIDPELGHGLLYDLVFTLASPETILEPEHLATCLHLWQRPQQQPWLAAALLRRCDPGPNDPDDATLRFVARRLEEDLQMQPASDIAELAEFIPTFMLMLSEEAWCSPATVWSELTRIGKEQMIGARAEPKSRESPHFTGTSKLASLFADSIGQDWTADLDLRVVELASRYPWLAALRDAARVELGLQQLRERGSETPTQQTPPWY